MNFMEVMILNVPNSHSSVISHMTYYLISGPRNVKGFKCLATEKYNRIQA